MRRRWILIWLLALVAVLGLGALAFARETGAEADPAVAEWSEWKGEVSCGSVPFDPLAAFANPADAEDGHTPAEIALRHQIHKTSGWYEPTKPDSWRLLFETSHHAEFARGTLTDGEVEVQSFERKGKGWSWIGSGGCQPKLLRHERAAITWTLARGQVLRPTTRVVKVDLGPGECASGISQDKRLERPAFREEDGALLMALWIRPVPRLGPHEAYTCVGIIEPPVKVRLPGALGERKLLDGGVFPPISSNEQIEREEGI